MRSRLQVVNGLSSEAVYGQKAAGFGYFAACFEGGKAALQVEMVEILEVEPLPILPGYFAAEQEGIAALASRVGECLIIGGNDKLAGGR